MDRKIERRGLGRGLSALMADVNVAADPGTPDRPRRPDMLVPVEKLVPNPDQPRRDFQPEALQELASSIRQKGVIQPLIVRALPDERYEIVAGERRWRATQLAGLDKIPAVIRDVPDEAAIAMALRLNTMTGWIMWMTVRTFEHLGTIREGLQSIAVPQTVTDRPGAVPLKVTGGRIEVQGLTHHYGKGRGGLAGIDLTIAAGERIGVVGPSGAGKSSLVNLILRLRDPEGGRILIDGQDIAGVTQDSLRAQIGMVTHDSSLLHRSVRDNILYGRPNATEAEMIAAAKRAEAHEFILTLRDTAGRQGYDALVGERGVRLSGGQRQRIALARVILKDAPILILDEATSALDSEAEAAIQQALYGVMEGKTVIAIAHRLSTIAQMDRIVVLEDGAIAEQGRHADLLARGGLYARFWARQSGGFIGSEDE